MNPKLDENHQGSVGFKERALRDSGMKASTGQSLGCSSCGLVTGDLMRCGRCKGAVYCSKGCQAAAWPDHKPLCKP